MRRGSREGRVSEYEGKESRGRREGRVSEDSRKESGVLVRMKGSRDKRVERKQRMKSHLGQWEGE